ncbi:MAG: hypothetical protein IPM66_05285 [Acidobacteriota bacterium]|nr:MAG: hypothetical protein IPM66_05285 [Acidobacteriota bacterium]
MKAFKFMISVSFLIIFLEVTIMTIKAQCDYSCTEQSCDGGLVWDFFACICIQPGSPIIIDLKNNGYKLTNAANGVRFDLAANGRPRQWSWTSRDSDDAFLALDRNGDGKIADGKELFGNFTEQPVTEEPNGFIALAVFDDNRDGWITEEDAVFHVLLLWTDVNHDGISQYRELQPLKSSNVKGLCLDYKLSRRSDRFGNRFRYKAPIRGEGIGKLAWDVFFLPGK